MVYVVLRWSQGPISMLQAKLYSKIAEVGNGGFCKAQNFAKE